VTLGMERRRTPRRVPDASEPVARFRLRTGRELTVVDLAATGALVETEGRLLPGTCVDVHVITADGRELVRSRVLRAFVWGLWADRIVYRGALAFDRHIQLAPGLMKMSIAILLATLSFSGVDSTALSGQS
jgi:hypothetical protein